MEYSQTFRRRWRGWLLVALLLSNLLVWLAVHTRQSGQNLKIYFLDVGQGDAILIDTPSRGRVLIDGGKNRQVLAHLGKLIPFADKRIDVIVATHPDSDHIGGLPEVVSRYNVGAILTPGVESENDIDDELDKRLSAKKIPTILARRGQVLNFGDGVTLTVLFPNQDVSSWDTNDASIVARLDYGESSFLFTGDAGIRTENILISLDKKILDTDVLKAGHHGSRTSNSLMFAEAVTPEYSVISASKDNPYGHPHQEVLNILKAVSSQVLSTALSGTLKFETDGLVIKVK